VSSDGRDDKVTQFNTLRQVSIGGKPCILHFSITLKLARAPVRRVRPPFRRMKLPRWT